MLNASVEQKKGSSIMLNNMITEDHEMELLV